MGMDWTLREGYSWAEDKEHCEEYGRMLQADPAKVSARAKKRGLPQLGTLGAGNHYGEVQVLAAVTENRRIFSMRPCRWWMRYLTRRLRARWASSIRAKFASWCTAAVVDLAIKWPPVCYSSRTLYHLFHLYVNRCTGRDGESDEA